VGSAPEAFVLNFNSSQIQVKGGVIALYMKTFSKLHRVSPVIWDHTVLPATRRRWARPASDRPVL